MPKLFLYDDDRTPTRAGDRIVFSYGIPPICVRADVVRRGRSLVALTPGHIPTAVNLRSLRRCVGAWYKLPLESKS